MAQATNYALLHFVLSSRPYLMLKALRYLSLLKDCLPRFRLPPVLLWVELRITFAAMTCEAYSDSILNFCACRHLQSCFLFSTDTCISHILVQLCLHRQNFVVQAQTYPRRETYFTIRYLALIFSLREEISLSISFHLEFFMHFWRFSRISLPD